MNKKLKDFLDRKVEEYNRPSFIEHDPIVIPHLFSKKQDIEIAAFFAVASTLLGEVWADRYGRVTFISGQRDLETLLLQFGLPHPQIEIVCACCGEQSFGFGRALKRQIARSDAQRFLPWLATQLIQFKHRTFNPTDLLYFIWFLKHHYEQSQTLESAFSRWMKPKDDTIQNALTGFHDYFFSLQDAPVRTKKHIATPKRNSTCKRLNMFLRWMVRKDNCGVDFGIWNKISASQLVCPIDVHVARVAKRFHLIERKQIDWQTAMELTSQLKKFDLNDPVKYDFALFALGVVEKF